MPNSLSKFASFLPVNISPRALEIFFIKGTSLFANLSTKCSLTCPPSLSVTVIKTLDESFSSKYGDAN